MDLTYIGLFAILAMVLCLPFLVKKIEEELEFFLFAMGCIALTITTQWSTQIIREALLEPLKITIAVLVAGFIFRLLQQSISRNINKIISYVGIKWFVFLVIVILGLLSSVITAIIASLILVEIVSFLKLDRKTEIKIVVLACFSIGYGAALTPIGEPLSTIVIAKLKDNPYHADFFFLFRQLGYYLLFAVIACGIIGMATVKQKNSGEHRLREDRRETAKDILIRTVKVYLFVMALIFLGRGFKPVVDTYISRIPYHGLYWINMISAVLDNATLAAAEIGPSLQVLQIKSAILGLLIAGGMLIPGNIPNIISAGKLKIKSSEWAKFGVPIGLATMIVYFMFLK